jgi:GDP-mannose 6-dehydrogenase
MEENYMKVSIFGLGYVGCVSAACLASKGNKVIGVDISENKVNLINSGRPTIIEKDIDKLVKEGYEKNFLEATKDVEYAINNTEISIIAVGTPSSPTGHLNLSYIFKVSEQIGKALKNKIGYHVIAIRSTVLPGTNEKVGEIIEKYSNKKRNINFSIISNPEFLREGTAVKDYMNPPITLIGYNDEKAKDIMVKLYEELPAEIIATDIRVAEIMKYVNNTFHALKIVFGNEIGNICKELEIDSHKVMEIFCKDKQLNISPYYFKPGFAYGGSCLPKDSKALTTLAKDCYINVPVINSINDSNEIQKQKAIDMIINKGKRTVGILGLSFKAGTDDLRSSPIVDVVERLLGKGFELKIYDKNVKVSELTGTNKDYIESKIPHLQRFITDNLSSVINKSEVIVVTNKESEFEDILEKYPNKIIIDLVRMWDQVIYNGQYEGISWGSINKGTFEDIAFEEAALTK